MPSPSLLTTLAVAAAAVTAGVFAMAWSASLDDMHRMAAAGRKKRGALPPPSDAVLVVFTKDVNGNPAASSPGAKARHRERITGMARTLMNVVGVKAVDAYADDPENALSSPFAGVLTNAVSRPMYGALSIVLKPASDPAALAKDIATTILPQIIGPTGNKETGDVFVYHVKRLEYTPYGGYSGEATEAWTSEPVSWPSGTRSPVLAALTAFPKPERYAHMDNEKWSEDHWLNVQAPMSEIMQPRPRYVRHTILKSFTPNAPAYAGFVVETWPSVRHVLDPFLFFGVPSRNPYTVVKNIIIMLRSVARFTDVSSLQQAYAGEYLFFKDEAE